MTDILPMNMHEAVEVMKIIGTHAHLYTDTDKPIKVLKKMLTAIQADNPIQALRLIALMEHKTVEQIAEELKDSTAEEFIMYIADGLARNRLVNLIDAAFYLGIASSRWTYA